MITISGVHLVENFDTTLNHQGGFSGVTDNNRGFVFLSRIKSKKERKLFSSHIPQILGGFFPFYLDLPLVCCKGVYQRFSHCNFAR